MRLPCNNSIQLSLIVAALLLLVNQAFSFGIHRQPIPSHPGHVERRRLPQPKLNHHALFYLPRQSTADDSSLKLSENVVNQKESTPTSKAYSYHLLWTPGFGRKVMLSTLLLAICHRFVIPRLMNPSMSNASMGWISSVLLSLLASSCCLIQMLANVLISTVGCLGLNTALGPVRPYFFSLLLYVNALAVSKGLSTIPQVAVRSIIALLPEGLHVWTNFRNQRYRNSVQVQKKNSEVVTEDPSNYGNKLTSETSIPSKTTESTPEDENKIEPPTTKTTEVNDIEPSINNEPVEYGSINMVLELEVPTMGCVACINKIDRLMRESQEKNKESNKVRDVSSILHPDQAKGGKTIVQLSVGSAEEAEEIGKGLVEQLDKMGFPGASVVNRRR